MEFLYLFLFLSLFFESYDYCFKVQNLACSLRDSTKTPPIPREKSQTPQVPLVWNQPHISPPTRNPCLAKTIAERNQIKEQAGRVRKTHGTIIRTKEKQKANVAETTSNFCTLSAGGARLGMIEVLGRLKMPSILAAQSK